MAHRGNSCIKPAPTLRSELSNKRPLPSRTDDFFTEHLPYEITLVKETYPLLLTPRPWAEHNAFIVAFLNSSRLLIEFFKNKTSCDFDPRMFTKATFQLNTRFVRDSILPIINSQIMHLSAKRTKVLDEKIGESLWTEIRDALVEEVTRFERALLPDYQKKWPLKPAQTILIPAVQSQSSFPTFVGYTGPVKNPD
jgi:hypothetical protein